MNTKHGAGKVEFTVEEISSTLKRSKLPTVLIEGKDDNIVFRPLEEKFAAKRLSVFPVGGRSKLLTLFKEFEGNSQFLFIADKDAWCMSPLPVEFSTDQLIFTEGYSIENDAMRDDNMFALLTVAEKEKFEKDLEVFTKWYALAFSRFLSGDEETIKTHCSTILDDPKKRLELTTLKEGEQYPDALYAAISAKYKSVLRGKSLIHLLVRHLSYAGRLPRHHHAALLEGAATRPGPLLGRFYERVDRFLNEFQVGA